MATGSRNSNRQRQPLRVLWQPVSAGPIGSTSGPDPGRDLFRLRPRVGQLCGRTRGQETARRRRQRATPAKRPGGTGGQTAAQDWLGVPNAGAQGNRCGPGRVRHRAGNSQEDASGSGVQPLQAHSERGDGSRSRGTKVEHPADRANRFREDPTGGNPGKVPGRPVRNLRRHIPHGVGVCGRGRGEHTFAADPSRGLGCLPGGAGDHIYR